MAEQQKFFSQDEATSSSRVKKWYMVTNQRNLFYMLGSGLLMPPSGFGGKYYADTLACFPGWLPIFPDQVPKAAIEFSASEKSHLIPCILEIDLTALRGSVTTVGTEGNVIETGFPEGISGNEGFVLLPAPLPITWVTSVIIETREQKVSCEKDATDFDNVDLSDITLKVQKGVFNKTTDIHWPQQSQEISERKVPLERPLAAGGILAMMAQLGNTGDLAIDAAKLAFEQGAIDVGGGRYRIIAAISDWFDSRELNEDHGVSAKLYWRLVDSLVDAREQGSEHAPADLILAALTKVGTDLDADSTAGIETLIEDLRGVAGFGDNTVTELLERHSKPLPRSLLLFFLRETCSEFFEYRHDLLNAYDYVAAAILFGTRQRWLGLPAALRKMPRLEQACCHRMAVMSHKIAGTSVELGEQPARPESLRELLRDQPWKKTQNEAALMLARKSGWDCIRTRVSLGKGNYRLEIDGQGVHFVLDGEPKAVQTMADYDFVLNSLATEPLPTKIEDSVRSMLTGKSA